MFNKQADESGNIVEIVELHTEHVSLVDWDDDVAYDVQYCIEGKHKVLSVVKLKPGLHLEHVVTVVPNAKQLAMLITHCVLLPFKT